VADSKEVWNPFVESDKKEDEMSINNKKMKKAKEWIATPVKKLSAYKSFWLGVYFGLAVGLLIGLYVGMNIFGG
jgi:hypothetical protein